MVILLTVCGKQIKDMDKVQKFGQMEISMLGSGKQIVEMGKEYFIGKMEIFTMDNG